MIFDQFCGLVERHFPAFTPLLKQAKIFYFEGIAHEVLPSTFTPDELEEFTSNFFMPFPVTAVEDKASCILLMDAVPGQRGLHCLRYYFELIPASAPVEAFGDSRRSNYTEAQWARLNSMADRGVYHFYAGEIRDLIPAVYSGKDPWIGKVPDRCKPGGSGYDIDGSVSFAVQLTKHKIEKTNMHLLDPKDPKSEVNPAMRTLIRNPVAALEEIFYANQPHRFILETRRTDLKQKKSRKAKSKIPRSHERPLYTILRPQRIREVMGLPPVDRTPAGARATPTPTDVRAYVKFLRHYKWRFDPKTGEELPQIPIPHGPDKGLPHYRQVYVPAYWRGSSEAVVGNKIYKVRLDL